MKKHQRLLETAVICLLLSFIPMMAMASVESSMMAIQSKVISTLLPLAGVLGLCWAGFSFFIGHPAAVSRLWLAIFGAVVGFGANSIISLVRSLVN